MTSERKSRNSQAQTSDVQEDAVLEDAIRIFGTSENNLKHVDLALPKKRLAVFAGVSGSGKSSLSFDTLAVESAREWQAT